MDLVIFDLETTGFSPRFHEIIQIAAVRVRDGELVPDERFETFVRPEKWIPAEITELTGIDQSHVRTAPDLRAALVAFSRFVGKAVLVAHNGLRFDIPFIQKGCRRTRLPTMDMLLLDSMQLSKRVWPGAASHGLDAVILRLDLTMDGMRRHDARSDVQLQAKAVLEMYALLKLPLSQVPRGVASVAFPISQ